MADEDYSQKDRRFEVVGPSGTKDELLFREMTMRESISSLYTVNLSLYSSNPELKYEDVIGGALSIRMTLPDGGDISERYFHGLVVRFSQGPPSGRFITYHAEVVPWLWLLTRSSDCRIFQRMTVPDIIKQVFDDMGMTDYRLSLKGSYEKKEYCVQYRETHFNFVSRLMEEAGIGYFFEHAEKEHTLVLFDDPSENPSMPNGAETTYASVEDDGKPAGEIEDLHYEQELPSGKYAITDYNFEDPGMDLLAEVPSNIKIGENDKLEMFDYPGEYTAMGDGESKVKLRMEAEEASSYAIEARSSRGDFCSGHTFDLVGHFRGDFDKTYLVKSVVHQATQGYGEASDSGSSYTNHFSCIPHKVPFRPTQSTPKPIISGAQTATVVGASGSEIDVDEYGRVVVQFHWDRLGKRDENSSCRVRVSQNWAGKGWGAVFNPRIGHEVIVEFLEGDPDQPIITGRVYNGEQKVPYTVPADATQSGIKSRSSKEGGTDNFNEIRFEDKKGSELLSMQAEKDRETLIKNDETKNVGHDQSLAVGNDKTVEVSKNHQETVGENQKVEVGGDRNDKVVKNEIREVGKDRTRDVGENEEVTVGKDQGLSIGNERKVTVADADSLQVGADLTVSVDKNFQINVTKDYELKAKKVTIEAEDEIMLKAGKAKIQLKKNGDITIDGKKITIKGSGDVIMKGSKIKQN